MAWTFYLSVRNVNEPIGGTRLQITTPTSRWPLMDVPSTIQFSVEDAIQNLTLEFTHESYATLKFNLEVSSKTWLWDDPQQSVQTSGRDVRVTVTLLRARLAPTTYISEETLTRLATNAKQPTDLAAQKAGQIPPEWVPIAEITGAIADKNGFYRNSGVAKIDQFHILNPDPLGDPKQDGWSRYDAKLVSVNPWSVSRVHLFEYGEVGSKPAGPKFLVSVWLPNVAADIGYTPMDFLVWFTPNTTLKGGYPDVRYPFGGAYPYVLMAGGGFEYKDKKYEQKPYVAAQRYTTLSFSHYFNYHFLAYQTLAANRAVTLVIPSAPSSHFELWERPATLMRMIKELCRAIPRNYNNKTPKVHPPPPSVGRVGVTGFSSAGPRLRTLLLRLPNFEQYKTDIWGSSRDAADFDQAWRELWSIDGSFESLAKHSEFMQSVINWLGNSDRQARIYKNDYSNGRWDPRTEKVDPLASWVRSSSIVEKTAGDNWALSCADKARRLQTISISKSYALSGRGNDQPPLNNLKGPGVTHENMPRIFIGHAASTSKFRALS